MATGVKAAAFGAFLRVFYTAFYPFIADWSSVLWLIAVLTMCVGNITALVQNNMKRLLAYSSIAHAGYILIAFVTGDRVLSSSVLYYLLAYTFMNLGAFTVVIVLGRKGEEHEDIDSYAGLASRHPFVALCMTIFLLSLTGIPPLAGFAGKFYIFSDAMKARFYWLGVIGMLNSAVAAYYYLRVLMYMYFKEPVKEAGQNRYFPGLRRRDAGEHRRASLPRHLPEGLCPPRPEVRLDFRSVTHPAQVRITRKAACNYTYTRPMLWKKPLHVSAFLYSLPRLKVPDSR